MDERALSGFLQADLERYFDKYHVEKYVQRALRRLDINHVGDLVGQERMDVVECFANESQTVQERVLAFYDSLGEIRRKKEARISRQGEGAAPADGGDSEEKLPIENADSDPTAARAKQPMESDTVGSRRPPAERPSASTAEDPQQSSTAGVNDGGRPTITPPIRLGRVIESDRFGGETRKEYLELGFDEDGLRRHILIAGSTGSGKTVAARYIVEAAAISGVPSIVVDAQGDISSLVLQSGEPTEDGFLEAVLSIRKPANAQEVDDLKGKIRVHVNALKEHPGPLSSLFRETCCVRIFTPGRPEVGLPLALPPYVDVLGALSDESLDLVSRAEIKELLGDEVASFIKAIKLKVPNEKVADLTELLLRLFHHAHAKEVLLDGLQGIQNLGDLVKQAPELEQDFCERYGLERDLQKLEQAIFRQCTHFENTKWLDGAVFDVADLIRPTESGQTPVNIINVQELPQGDNRKRVLRHVIAAIYKFAVQSPKHSGPPSLLFYVDEIGTGYGERSVARPEGDAPFRVDMVLQRLVRQARKYGVSVMLASQSYTDFHPDIRKQLCSKIIGKVDEQAEQRRVIACVAEDLSGSATGDKNALAEALPRLGKPRLLFVDVNGRASVYRQLKCATLDVNLTAHDIVRWRQCFEEGVEAEFREAQADFDQGDAAAALSKTQAALAKSIFLPRLHPSVQTLMIRCLLGLGEFDEGVQLFNEAQNLEWAAANHHLVSEAISCVPMMRATVLVSRRATMLEKALKLVRNIDERLRDSVQLELSKQSLLEGDDIKAVEKELKQIAESSAGLVGLFARGWRRVVAAFGDWTESWRPSLRDPASSVKLAELSKDRRSIVVTTVSSDENRVVVGEVYTPGLIEHPEILQPSRAFVDPAVRSSPEAALGRVEGNIAGSATRRQAFERARQHRRAGRQEDAVRFLDEWFLEHPTMRPDAATRELSEFDRDPAFRRARVGTWLDGLDWRQFEAEVCGLFLRMGYEAWLTPRSGDEGVDVVARKEGAKVVVQCKHWKSNVGLGVIQALVGARESWCASDAVIVTSSRLEPAAVREAERMNVNVIDGRQLVALFDEHFGPEETDRNQGQQPHGGQVEDPVGDKRAGMGDGPVATSSRGDDWERILHLVREKGEIKNSDVRELLGVEVQAARHRLRRLVDRGLLEMHGDKATTYYTLVDGPQKKGVIGERLRGNSSSRGAAGPSCTRGAIPEQRDLFLAADSRAESGEPESGEASAGSVNPLPAGQAAVDARSSALAQRTEGRNGAADEPNCASPLESVSFWRDLVRWAEVGNHFDPENRRILASFISQLEAGENLRRDQADWAAMLHRLAIEQGYCPENSMGELKPLPAGDHPRHRAKGRQQRLLPRTPDLNWAVELVVRLVAKRLNISSAERVMGPPSDGDALGRDLTIYLLTSGKGISFAELPRFFGDELPDSLERRARSVSREMSENPSLRRVVIELLEYVKPSTKKKPNVDR